MPDKTQKSNYKEERMTCKTNYRVEAQPIRRHRLNYGGHEVVFLCATSHLVHQILCSKEYQHQCNLRSELKFIKYLFYMLI